MPLEIENFLCSKLTRRTDYCRMINTGLPEGLKTISVFEDFDEKLLGIFQRQGGLSSYIHPDPVRVPLPAVGAAFAARSRQLESLSVAFIADARHFFNGCQPQWRWDNLQSLALTSRLMTPTSCAGDINNLLQDAGKAALCMPKLQRMTLWNGAKGEACAFVYSKKDASIIWRGTWQMKLELHVVQAWEQVARMDTVNGLRGLQIETILLDCDIRSHGDAVYHLNLRSVLDPVSLKQIRMENSRS